MPIQILERMRAEIRSRATNKDVPAEALLGHRITNGIAVIDVGCTLSHPENRKRFRSSVGFLVSHRQPHIIINLSSLRYIGSLDIAVVIGACKAVLDEHGSMGLVLNDRIKHVFDVMGIEIWGRYESEEAAMDYYRSHGAFSPPYEE